MATFVRLPSGSWRAVVRRKKRYVSETFALREDARKWATEAERQIDRGQTATPARAARRSTFGDLIDLHIEDMKSVGRAPRRSKHATLEMFKRRLGRLPIAQIDREGVIAFGRERAREGACPMTLSIDVGVIKLVLTHAAAIHGLPVPVESVDLARVALKRLGLIGKKRARPMRRSGCQSMGAR